MFNKIDKNLDISPMVKDCAVVLEFALGALKFLVATY